MNWYLLDNKAIWLPRIQPEKVNMIIGDPRFPINTELFLKIDGILKVNDILERECIECGGRGREYYDASADHSYGPECPFCDGTSNQGFKILGPIELKTGDIIEYYNGKAAEFSKDMSNISTNPEVVFNLEAWLCVSPVERVKLNV